jgi:ribosome-binding protein aMBF1 (putative translation factor)
MYNPKYDDADLADAVVLKLKTSFNNSLDLPKAPLEKYNVESDYDNFYQEIKQLVDFYDENINYITKTKTMSQEDFAKDLIAKYNSIIERYNAFGD